MEDIFNEAMCHVLSDNYTPEDVRAIKRRLTALLREGATIKKKMDDNKHQFLKKKTALQRLLKENSKSIKEIQKILGVL